MAYKFQLGKMVASGSIEAKEGLKAGDADVENVGKIALDEIKADGNDIQISLNDDRATALKFVSGSTNMAVFRTNLGMGKNRLELSASAILASGEALQFSDDSQIKAGFGGKRIQLISGLNDGIDFLHDVQMILQVSSSGLFSEVQFSGSSFDFGGSKIKGEETGDLTAKGTIRSKSALSGATLSIGGGAVSATEAGALTSKGTLRSKGELSGATLALGGGNFSVTHGGILTAAELRIGNAQIVESELEMIDGITAGTGAASKALVLDASRRIGNISHLTASILSASALHVAASTIHVGGVAINSAEIAVLDDISAGTVAAGKAVVVDASKDISAFRNLTGVALIGTTSVSGAAVTTKTGGLSIGGVAVSSTAAELNLLDTAAAGTVVNSKAVIYNGSGHVHGVNISGSDALQGKSLSVAAAANAGSVVSTTTVQATTQLSGASLAIGGGNFSVTHGGVLTAQELRIGNAQIVESELEMLDTITAGTGSASKALVLGASRDIANIARLTADSVRATNIGITADPDLLALSSAQLQVNGKLVVMNDLDIRGNTTTISTTNTEFNDTLIGLGFASGSNDRAVGDRGLIFGLDSEDDAAIFWDETESQFAFAKTDSGLDATAVNVTGYADLRVNALTAANIVELVQTLTSTGAISLSSGSIILANANGGAITLTLPAASGNSGKIVKIKKINTNGNAVNISGNGSETIDGSTVDLVLESPLAAVSLICDGSNWHIM